MHVHIIITSKRSVTLAQRFEIQGCHKYGLWSAPFNTEFVKLHLQTQFTPFTNPVIQSQYNLMNEKRVCQYIIKMVIQNTLQEENVHRNLNFAISPIANSLNFNSACYQILRNLSMIAYINKIQKSTFPNI